MKFENSIAFARAYDASDALAAYRDKFYIPEQNGQPVVYLCGNSLGLQPKATRAYIEQELLDWQNLGVDGHFDGMNPWFSYHKMFAEPVAKLVGGLPQEVVVMNVLTVNLHLMMTSFYRPKGPKFKIIMEGGAFPSDYYAIESQVKLHGHTFDEAVIELKPREGEFALRHEDIVNTIDAHAEELCLVLMGGVNYYTGQAYHMKEITASAHKAGALAGFDLAHAAGNLKLDLHNWDVDFAVWCTYKYLNSGPGGVGGVFVHERWADKPELQRLAGWWGYDEATRFQMKKGFKPSYGAEGWQLSNAQILPMAAHKASLDIFMEAGMDALRSKSDKLTAYLEYLLRDNMQKAGREIFNIITPSDISQRGAQLSMLAAENGRQLFDHVLKNGIVADWREPNVIRVAPVPLYNSFEDVYKFSAALFSFQA